mmetsp:Transcript_95324/g.308825  ORF Transcript_95324/g.308825 Transcript_95324/m.308825 type:complete len:369 (-) Transcript_95324:74-1180(-)
MLGAAVLLASPGRERPQTEESIDELFDCCEQPTWKSDNSDALLAQDEPVMMAVRISVTKPGGMLPQMSVASVSTLPGRCKSKHTTSASSVIGRSNQQHTSSASSALGAFSRSRSNLSAFSRSASQHVGRAKAFVSEAALSTACPPSRASCSHSTVLSVNSTWSPPWEERLDEALLIRQMSFPVEADEEAGLSCQEKGESDLQFGGDSSGSFCKRLRQGFFLDKSNDPDLDLSTASTSEPPSDDEFCSFDELMASDFDMCGSLDIKTRELSDSAVSWIDECSKYPGAVELGGGEKSAATMRSPKRCEESVPDAESGSGAECNAAAAAEAWEKGSFSPCSGLLVGPAGAGLLRRRRHTTGQDGQSPCSSS